MSTKAAAQASSSSGSSGKTNNSFAVVLQFYEHNRMCKLNSTDLGKIAKKYANKPASLVKDLRAKYNIPLPVTLPFNQLGRLLALYDIPPTYRALLPEVPAADAYNAALDVNSDSFDLNLLFSKGRIIGPDVPITTYDNLLKVRHTLFPEKFNHDPNFRLDRKIIDKAKEVEVKRNAERHPLNLIASVACQEAAKGSVLRGVLFEGAASKAGGSSRGWAVKNAAKKLGALESDAGPYGPSSSSTSSSSSSGVGQKRKQAQALVDDYALPDEPHTFSLLFDLMQQKKRVVVVTRSRSKITGVLVGWIKGFDRHCNLLLHDVDEQFLSVYCHKPRWERDSLSHWSHRECCYMLMRSHVPAVRLKAGARPVLPPTPLDEGAPAWLRLDPKRLAQDIVYRHHAQLLVRGDAVVSVGVVKGVVNVSPKGSSTNLLAVAAADDLPAGSS